MAIEWRWNCSPHVASTEILSTTSNSFRPSCLATRRVPHSWHTSVQELSPKCRSIVGECCMLPPGEATWPLCRPPMLAIGYDVAWTNARQAAALHAAAWNGYVELVELLLQHHAPLARERSRLSLHATGMGPAWFLQLSTPFCGDRRRTTRRRLRDNRQRTCVGRFSAACRSIGSRLHRPGARDPRVRRPTRSRTVGQCFPRQAW